MPFLQVNEAMFPSEHETLLPCLPGFLKQPLQGDLCKQMRAAFGVSELVSSIAGEPFAQAACSEHKFLLYEWEKIWAAEWHCKGDTRTLEGTRVFRRPLGVKSLGKHWWPIPE